MSAGVTVASAPSRSGPVRRSASRCCKRGSSPTINSLIAAIEALDFKLASQLLRHSALLHLSTLFDPDSPPRMVYQPTHLLGHRHADSSGGESPAAADNNCRIIRPTRPASGHVRFCCPRCGGASCKHSDHGDRPHWNTYWGNWYVAGALLGDCHPDR